MKNFRFQYILILLLVFVLLCLTAFQAFGQQKDTLTTASKPCVCDSTFIMRLNYRIERQTDFNDRMKSAIKDREEATALLESRLDSLRSYVHEWMHRITEIRSPPRNAPKTKKHKP